MQKVSPMSRFAHNLAFHPTGKPRGWVRRLVFERDRTPRSIFRRVVFKKNGRVRPVFETWMKVAQRPELHSQLSGRGDSWGNAVAHLGHVGETLRTLRPLEATVRSWMRHGAPPAPISEHEVADRLKACFAAKGKWLLVSVGHDNYTRISGGIQMCIQREEKSTLSSGGTYLNIHPWQPLPRLAHFAESPNPFVNLILDGSTIGTCRMSDLVALVRRMTAHGVETDIVIHQLLGHNPEQIAKLVNATGSGRCLFWLHDFLSLCPSFTLQRNNVAFCAAPPITSNACALCIYGEERREHSARMAKLFQDVDVQLVSPSQVTLDFWTKHSDLRVMSKRVVPHMTLEWIRRATPAAIDPCRPVTVAFLGTPATHKGWPIFERLSKESRSSKAFRFLLFGTSRPPGATIKRIDVHVTADKPMAMSDAIALEEVDIVVHWPSWPETFSLTTYEALAGGAFLVTNATSGNVAATVKETRRGAVLEDEAELFKFFGDGRAELLAQQSRASRAGSSVVHGLSDMSVSLLMQVR
jgi:hypothetical protein